MVGVRFSQDGKRLMAASEYGGVVMVWDVATGKELLTIDMVCRNLRGLVVVSEDWRTVFGGRTGSQKVERREQNGESAFHYLFDGCVRAWDLGTGRSKRVFRAEPSRFIFGMQLASDASAFATLEWPAGTYENRPPMSASLWDAKTGDCYRLPGTVGTCPLFSSDGRTVLFSTTGPGGFANAISSFDRTTRSVSLSVPLHDKTVDIDLPQLSPDGGLLAANYLVHPGRRGRDFQLYLKVWSAKTGAETLTVKFPKGDGLIGLRFSPNSEVLAAGYSHDGKADVLLYRPAAGTAGTATRTITVAEKKGESFNIKELVFSADSKWIALITQAQSGRETDPQYLPQPRIHLIEAATGRIAATLISPQAISVSACFSSDLGTLATGGYGRVVLWDIRSVCR
jgi:WD40 repeat protein